VIKLVEWSTPAEKDLATYYEYLLKRGLLKNKAKLKNTIHLQCTHCNVIIHSSYSGEYVSCKCGKIGIDQTEFYTRMIGNKEDYLVVNNEDNDNAKTL
jgi:hypothetical protein